MLKTKKKRVSFVFIFLILFALYAFISVRGEYLEILNAGEKYVDVFNTNMKYKFYIALINIVILYIITYCTTLLSKKGLKKFFDDEKKEMPKLPNKSIAFIFSIIVGLISSNIIFEKLLIAMNKTSFAIADPIFGLDLSFFIFQEPFIKLMLIYIISIVVLLSVYILIYYIVTFNVYFPEGIDRQILRKNIFFKQLVANIIIITICISVFILVGTVDILGDKFIALNDGTRLYGAGRIDTTVKLWGYIIFSLIVILAVIMAIKNIKKQKSKKILFWLGMIPTYLVVLFVVIVLTDLIYVNRNELDKEKSYIYYNMQFTKAAYSINAEEIEVKSSGTITQNDIQNNVEVIDNINLINSNLTLETLEEYQTNLGYYSYKTTSPNLYNINGKETLVYVSPREIVNDEIRTYNNRTYEYTHGYGAIITSASNTDRNGQIQYIQSDFNNTNNSKIYISQPRIYFGMQTNETIVTNVLDKEEYDYPLTSSTNTTNEYDGKAGLNLNFADRLILGIKDKNLKLAFSTGISKDSNIIVNRNIRERAKSVMPYLLYDENPYMVITDEGRLVWVLDAYTVSNNYPYSQESIIGYEGEKIKINYIKNSVKVLIDSYDGTMDFYITDRTDPIVMAYRNIYPNVFQDLETDIPESIAKHLLYPKYLYNIQAKMIERYHEIQTEVLYRTDDVWSIAKENTSKTLQTNSNVGTEIEPYYTVVKTLDNNESNLALVIPYTLTGKQNIISYLVGTYDENNKLKLKIYKFKTEDTILGTMQLDKLIDEDEKISEVLEKLNTTGSKIIKNTIVVPINNTLIYIEPIYQIMVNEEPKLPILKNVIVASGNKVAIGETLQIALNNLLSKEAVNIVIDTTNKEELIRQIINANNNLEQSNASNDWEMIGQDISKLQNLIKQLENLQKEESNEIENDEELEDIYKHGNVTNTNVIVEL